MALPFSRRSLAWQSPIKRGVALALVTDIYSSPSQSLPAKDFMDTRRPISVSASLGQVTLWYKMIPKIK